KTNMASDNEDENLNELRSAVLASLSSKKQVVKDDDEEDLNVLREAALQSRKLPLNPVANKKKRHGFYNIVSPNLIILTQPDNANESSAHVEKKNSSSNAVVRTKATGKFSRFDTDSSSEDDSEDELDFDRLKSLDSSSDEACDDDSQNSVTSNDARKDGDEAQTRVKSSSSNLESEKCKINVKREPIVRDISSEPSKYDSRTKNPKSYEKRKHKKHKKRDSSSERNRQREKNKSDDKGLRRKLRNKEFDRSKRRRRDFDAKSDKRTRRVVVCSRVSVGERNGKANKSDDDGNDDKYNSSGDSSDNEESRFKHSTMQRSGIVVPKFSRIVEGVDARVKYDFAPKLNVRDLRTEKLSPRSFINKTDKFVNSSIVRVVKNDRAESGPRALLSKVVAASRDNNDEKNSVGSPESAGEKLPVKLRLGSPKLSFKCHKRKVEFDEGDGKVSMAPKRPLHQRIGLIDPDRHKKVIIKPVKNFQIKRKVDGLESSAEVPTTFSNSVAKALSSPQSGDSEESKLDRRIKRIKERNAEIL
ncbi:Uncharacterised protein PB.1511, partial [Pycnogonum litorale]